MKKLLIIASYSLYLFFLLGFLLHTSAHPFILGKYTLRYMFFLLFLFLFSPFYLYVTLFLLRTSLIRWNGKKILLSPRQKGVIGLIILVFCVLTPAEIFLRYKYRNYESNSYQYTLDNFNPFLQSQIAKQENLPVDSLGFRNEEINRIKPKGTFRIVVLGGSTVLNREVSFDNNAVRVLEKKLRVTYPGKKIEVINAGKDYYTSEHSLIQYMFKIEDLQPDLIIMWHGINDMTASCTLEGVVTHGSYASDYSHLYGAVSAMVFNYFHPPSVIQIKLLTVDFLFKALVDNLYSDMTNIVQKTSDRKAAIEFLHNKNTVTVSSYPSILAYKRNLQYLIFLTKRQGVPLILGNQASLYKKSYSLEEVERIMSPRLICIKEGKYYSLASLQDGLSQFNQMTKDIAQQNDILFIDLDKSVPKNLNYFFDNVHYTVRGNERIAEALYSFITTHQLISGETR